MQDQLPDHRGVWVIKPPPDMPITQIAMLQATIAEYWAEYPGDPNDTELFWDFLTESMANVPRETSTAGEVTLRGYNERGEEVTTTIRARTVERMLSTSKHPFDMYQLDDNVFVRADEMIRALGGNVPRETSGGDDAPAT